MPPRTPVKAALGLTPDRQVGPEDLLEDEGNGPPQGDGGGGLSESQTPDSPPPENAPQGYSWAWLPSKISGVVIGYGWELIVARSKYVSEWFQTDGSRWGMTADGTVELIQEPPAPGEVEPRVVEHEVLQSDGSIARQAYTLDPQQGLVPVGDPQAVAPADPSQGGALTEFQAGQLELSREKFEFQQREAAQAETERAGATGLQRERFGLEQQRFQAEEAERARQAQVEAQRFAANPRNIPLLVALQSTGQLPRFSGQPLRGPGDEVIPQAGGQIAGLPPTTPAGNIPFQENLQARAAQLRAGGLRAFSATGFAPAAIQTTRQFGQRVTVGAGAPGMPGQPGFFELLAQGQAEGRSPLDVVTPAAFTTQQAEQLRIPSAFEISQMTPQQLAAKEATLSAFGLPFDQPGSLAAARQRLTEQEFGGAQRFAALRSGAAVTPGAAQAGAFQREAEKRRRAQERIPFSTAQARGSQRFR